MAELSHFQMDDVAFPVAGNDNMSRTPPTNTPSSYGRHVFKRGRMGPSSGSIGGWGNGGSYRKSSMDTGKSSLSTSLSGRLRSVSDLERSGLVSASEKGALKDLVITGDEALRSALDKYQSGDPTELEALISAGHLDRSGSIDLTELDNLDLGSLGIEGMDFLNMFDSSSAQTGIAETDSGDLDYDFAATSGGFEMDDLLNLPFGGMDELMPQDGMTGSMGGSSGSSSTQRHASSLSSSATGPSAFDMRITLPNPNAAGGGGGGGGSGGGSSSASTRSKGAKGPKRSTPSATPPSTNGTTCFPNSTDSHNAYPTSNSVSVLPALDTLPQGQAPAYEQLINFQRAKSKDLIKCVMCGKAPSDGEGGTVIPQQNKDVCRDCDKALWVHNESKTYFKWCKGCKRFRNIVAFSEKLDASKCNGCRERGRRSYLQRKGVNGASSGGAAAAAPAVDANPAPMSTPLPTPATVAVAAAGHAGMASAPVPAASLHLAAATHTAAAAPSMSMPAPIPGLDAPAPSAPLSMVQNPPTPGL